MVSIYTEKLFNERIEIKHGLVLQEAIFCILNVWEEDRAGQERSIVSRDG